MRAVINDVPDFILEWRRRCDGEQFDEMWDGILHVNMPQTIAQSEFVSALLCWMHSVWKTDGAKVLHGVAVSIDEDWMNNFRIPDLIAMTRGRKRYLTESHVHGPPALAVEVHHLEDEAYEKLPYYATMRIPDVWIIERDTWRPEVYSLVEDKYQLQTTREFGWLRSEAVGIELQHAPDNRLCVRIAGNDTPVARLPDWSW